MTKDNNTTDCPHRIRRDGLSKGDDEKLDALNGLKRPEMPTFTRKEGRIPTESNSVELVFNLRWQRGVNYRGGSDWPGRSKED